jgi:hypothetical protein
VDILDGMHNNITLVVYNVKDKVVMDDEIFNIVKEI